MDSREIITAPCPRCAAPAEIVEVFGRAFGGYGLRCANLACPMAGMTVVYSAGDTYLDESGDSGLGGWERTVGLLGIGRALLARLFCLRAEGVS